MTTATDHELKLTADTLDTAIAMLNAAIDKKRKAGIVVRPDIERQLRAEARDITERNFLANNPTIAGVPVYTKIQNQPAWLFEDADILKAYLAGTITEAELERRKQQ